MSGSGAVAAVVARRKENQTASSAGSDRDGDLLEAESVTSDNGTDTAPQESQVAHNRSISTQALLAEHGKVDLSEVELAEKGADGAERPTLSDKKILQGLYVKVQQEKQHKQNYIQLAAFLLFAALYMAVLYLQQQSFQTYEVATAHEGLLPPNTFVFSGPSAIYNWINSSIIGVIYADPVCGDGICEQPQEFPGFGTAGCAADCGLLQSVSAVNVQLVTTFQSQSDLDASSWNFCMTSPASICWFPEDQPFVGLSTTTTIQFAIPDGTWQVQITAPNGGVAGSVSLPLNTSTSGSNSFLGLEQTQSLASWGGCVAQNSSNLLLCRTECTRFAVCAALACSNLGRSAMAEIVSDCFQICDIAPTKILTLYTNTTCYQVAAAIDNESSFLGVYGTISNCSLDPNYDGRSPDNGLQGLAWDGDSLVPEKTTASPPAHARRLKVESHEFDARAWPRPGPSGQGLEDAAHPSYDYDALRDELSGRTTQHSHNVESARWSPSLAREHFLFGQQEGKLYLDRHRRKLASNTTTTGDSSVPPSSIWESFGATDERRLEVLEVGIARFLYTVCKRPCLTEFFPDPSRNAARYSAFFCTYFGGPATLAGCNYSDPRTGKQLTNITDLRSAMVYAHRNLNLSQDQSDSFVEVLADSIFSASFIPTGVYAVMQEYLHKFDDVLVTAPRGCNTVDISLGWSVGVHYNTSIVVGDTIRWIWEDQEPHSIREVQVTKGPYFNPTGSGSGHLLVSRGTTCNPENTGWLRISQLPPVPCVITDLLATGSAPNTFGYAWKFTEPGTYYYEDGRFGDLMTGVVTVSPDNPGHYIPGRSLVEQTECEPGCPLYRIRNGQCKDDCNNKNCAFDGGDCACSDNSYGAGSCNCYPGQARTGAGACCDASTVGTGLAFPFNLTQFGPNPLLLDAAFVPSNNFTKERIWALKNRVLIGMLIHQTRGDSQKCGVHRFDNLYATCLSRTSSTSPYGVDPVFLTTSVLYDQTLNASDYYAPSEINSQGVPYGFFSRPTKGYSPGYTVVFDTNLNYQQAVDRLQYLQDGFFIDNATKSLTVQLVTYNGDSGAFVNTEVTTTFQNGGKLAIQWSLNAVSVDLYRTVNNWIRAVLEVVATVAVMYNIYGEILEWYYTWKEEGRFFAYFDSFWNFVDDISLALIFSCLMLWYVNYLQLSNNFKLEPRYDIYQDVLAPARYFALADGGRTFDVAVGKFDHVRQIFSFRALYMALNGINLFLIMLRLLKVMHFQPRMGIITRTLSAAGPELLNFFLLLGIIFVIYSLMAHLVFGRIIDQYRTLAVSLVTNFNLIIGDNSVEYQLLLLQGWELVAGQIFYWTFVIFVSFILMNFLIAIVVDAFVDAKANAESAPTMPAEVVKLTRATVRELVQGELTDSRLLVQLKDWERRYNSHEEGSGSDEEKEPLGERKEQPRLKRISTLKLTESLVVRLGTDDPNSVEEIQELDFPTMETIFERSNGKAVHKHRRKASRGVAPHRAARSVFVRFGENPRQAQRERAEEARRKRLSHDARVLKGLLDSIEGSLGNLDKRLDIIEEYIFAEEDEDAEGTAFTEGIPEGIEDGHTLG